MDNNQDLDQIVKPSALSTSYFQCQFCQMFCLTTTKVKEHMEIHQNTWNHLLCDTTIPWLQDVLPITKVTFFECHIPLTRIRADVKVTGKEEMPLVAIATLEEENGLNSQDESEAMPKSNKKTTNRGRHKRGSETVASSRSPKYKDKLTRRSYRFRCKFPGCNQTYYSTFNLKRHERVHGPGALCPICFGKFSTPETVKAHLQNVHTPKDVQILMKAKHAERQRRYRYERRFQKSQVNGAISIDELANRTYTCAECGAEFARAFSLQSHLSSVHQKSILDQAPTVPVPVSNSVILLCRFCAYPAKDNLDLEAHLEDKHQRRFRCHYNNCIARFSTEEKLKEHLEMIHEKEVQPEFKCEFCGKLFMKKKSLLLHKRTMHDESGGWKIVECHICKKMYSGGSIDNHLKRHEDVEKIAKGEKVTRNQCKLCNDNFSSGFALRRHIDNVHLKKSVKKNQELQGTAKTTEDRSGGQMSILGI